MWDQKNAQRVVNWLESYDDRKPFFLSFGMYATHRRFPDQIDADIKENCIRPPEPIPDSPATRKDFASYMTSAKSADQCIGMVLDKLKEKRFMRIPSYYSQQIMGLLHCFVNAHCLMEGSVLH